MKRPEYVKQDARDSTIQEEEAGMAALKVGMIGCGSIARSVHLPILTGMPNVELIALAEPDPQRRTEAGRCAPGAARFMDYQELLRLPELQTFEVR